MDSQTIDGTVVSETAVVPVSPTGSAVKLALWGSEEPREITRRATAVADALRDVVRSRKLAVQIQGREYVLAEGWAMVGAILGVFPQTDATPMYDDDFDLIGYKGTCQLVTKGGEIVGGATAIATREESGKAGRDQNQTASMAQTRATAKAFRLSFGFIMPLAGYQATPAEEMESIAPSQDQERAPERPQERPQRPQSRPPDKGPYRVTEATVAAITAEITARKLPKDAVRQFFGTESVTKNQLQEWFDDHPQAGLDTFVALVHAAVAPLQP